MQLTVFEGLAHHRPNISRAFERGLRAEFRPFVYDLAPVGFRYLSDCDLREDTVRPTGH